MSPRFDFSAPALAALAQADAARALQEDVADGDLTASLVDPGRRARARVLARESAVLCGAPWVEATVRQLDPQARIEWLCAEGERCAADQTVLEIEGSARALLTAERTALNFLQLLSAVATKTALYADAIRGTRASIVDTRKTLPGLRLAQKYAVRTGGGVNHRIGLYDAVLIKENHIAAAGGVAWRRWRIARPLSRSRSKRWRSCARHWMRARAWCCSTTWTCRRCAKPFASTTRPATNARPCSRYRVASRSKACAPWPKRG
jgi:nicotinate-nucleotide pyrophosphorylase (carboxylating)